MVGVVNALLEATIRVGVQDATSQSHLIEAEIDTGFTGDLTLPLAAVNPLGLPWASRQRGVMADGNVHSFDVYTATILWDGQPRVVEVQALEVRPLLGTRLLQGQDLRIEWVPGGRVEIKPLVTPTP